MNSLPMLDLLAQGGFSEILGVMNEAVNGSVIVSCFDIFLSVLSR